MDFEDEEAESFGLANIAEMSMLNRLDLLTCVECGRCTEACPAHGADSIKPKNNCDKAETFPLDVLGKNKTTCGEKPNFYDDELDVRPVVRVLRNARSTLITWILSLSQKGTGITLGEIPPAAMLLIRLRLITILGDFT